MDTQRAAEVQAVLEGIPLPAGKQALLDYASANDPGIVRDLEGLPDREFERLDEVGELLTLTPSAPEPAMRLPKAESGKPPGGDDYLRPFPGDTGRVPQGAS